MGRAFASRIIPVPPPARTERPLSTLCSPQWGPALVGTGNYVPPWAPSRCEPIHDGNDYNPPASNSVARERGTFLTQQPDLQEPEENITTEEHDDAREADDSDGYVVVDGEDMF